MLGDRTSPRPVVYALTAACLTEVACLLWQAGRAWPATGTAMLAIIACEAVSFTVRTRRRLEALGDLVQDRGAQYTPTFVEADTVELPVVETR